MTIIITMAMIITMNGYDKSNNDDDDDDNDGDNMMME